MALNNSLKVLRRNRSSDGVPAAHSPIHLIDSAECCSYGHIDLEVNDVLPGWVSACQPIS